jgi:polysaccharide biosynthesis transport protein
LPSYGNYLPPSIDLSALPVEGQPATPPMDLRTLIEGLLRRWKLIIAVPILLLIVTGAVLKMVPPRFQSTVQLLMFDPQQASADAIGRQGASAGDFDTEALTTEIAVIQSASLALRVAKDLDLANDPEFQLHSRLAAFLEKIGVAGNGWVATDVRGLLQSVGLSYVSDAKDQGRIPADGVEADAKAATAAFLLRREHIRVDRVPFSYVLAVSAASRSPETAQRLAAKIVDDYLAGLREGRQQALQQTAVWLKAKLAELKSRVAETETTIEKLKSESGLSDTGKGNVTEQQVADLNSQLMTVRADLAEKRAQLDQAHQLSITSAGLQDIPEGATSAMIGQLRQEQSQLTQREARLRSEMGDLNPEVLAVAAQLAAVNRAVSQESAHILANLQNSYDVVRRREQSLEASLQRLTAAQNGSGDYVRLQQLQRIADADSKLYDTYLAQYNEIDTRQSLQPLGPKIISPATIPTEPSFPPTGLVYLVAGIIGIGIGVVVAFLSEYYQASVKTGAQARQIFGHPVLGAIPLVSQRQFLRADRAQDLVQAVVTSPMSPLSEAVRAVRIGLRLANPGRDAMVVLVTSSLPGEGKSSIAMLLGASSATAGENTVVVDCDLRSRTISREFDEQQPGLTDVLTGTADIAAVAVRHPTAGCDVIPAGSRSHTPADLLASRRMAEVIARLRERYDYIIIDTAPLLAVVDPLALATIADKILVAIGNNTRSENISESFRLLRPEIHRVAGMIFNKVAPDQLRRYGTGTYY